MGDAETQRPDEAKTPTVTVIADSAEWRVLVAGWAFRFFSLIHDPEVAKLIGKTVNPKMTDYWCVSDFTKYLGKIGLSGDLGQLTRILKAMERAGLLLAAGWDRMQPIFFGQQYVTQGFTSPQLEGNLWLSEVLGAELIIPSYNAVTVLLAGTDLEGNPGQHWGTGLILDETHIVTNKHVVVGLRWHIARLPAATQPGRASILRPRQGQADAGDQAATGS